MTLPADPPQSPDPGTLWQQALRDLELQMTKSTFETWLRDSRAVRVDGGGALIVATPSPYAVEWLENRLHRSINTTLQRLGHAGAVRFIVASPGGDGEKALAEVAEDEAGRRPTPLTPSKAVIELMDFDPTTRGWVQTPAYALQFWQPYLGSGPFLLWQTLRSFAMAGGEWPSIQTLADIVAPNKRDGKPGDKQYLIGRPDRNQIGWIEILEVKKILAYKLIKQRYIFRVLDKLPLLTPTQVERLSLERQQAHSSFLAKTSLDLREWQQLTLDSLAKDIEMERG